MPAPSSQFPLVNVVLFPANGTKPRIVQLTQRCIIMDESDSGSGSDSGQSPGGSANKRTNYSFRHSHEMAWQPYLDPSTLASTPSADPGLYLAFNRVARSGLDSNGNGVGVLEVNRAVSALVGVRPLSTSLAWRGNVIGYRACTLPDGTCTLFKDAGLEDVPAFVALLRAHEGAQYRVPGDDGDGWEEVIGGGSTAPSASTEAGTGADGGPASSPPGEVVLEEGLTDSDDGVRAAVGAVASSSRASGSRPALAPPAPEPVPIPPPLPRQPERGLEASRNALLQILARAQAKQDALVRAVHDSLAAQQEFLRTELDVQQDSLVGLVSDELAVQLAEVRDALEAHRGIVRSTLREELRVHKEALRACVQEEMRACRAQMAETVRGEVVRGFAVAVLALPLVMVIVGAGALSVWHFVLAPAAALLRDGRGSLRSLF
ncbi:hypothetical protein C8Q76DRAFT_793855 [Earliella scabrosa]|nr:hypothetical protein C8Q76DRAFT_793855 [Earliella scabrosa]